MTKIKSKLFFLALILSLTMSGSLYAQQDSYAGNESKIDAASLLSEAKKANFDNNICVKIFKDVKNTYYAVDVSQLTSKYEKIRLLELSYEDKALVSMGSDNDVKYYFFLVNNTLDKTPQEVADIITNFLSQSKVEEKKLNSEQLRLWLIQHDKYSK